MTITDIILRYREAFISGLFVTLSIATIAWVFGLTVGTLFGVFASRYKLWVGYPLRAASFTLAAIPPIVLLYWAHYPLQVALDIVIDPFVTASSVFCISNIVVVAEIIRSALDNFHKEYRIAAQVCGMNRWETFKFVEFPLITRQVLPGILASQVLILQSTLFASLISVEELFRVAQRINSSIYMPIQIYSALALFFLVICMPIYILAFILRQRFLREIYER